MSQILVGLAQQRHIHDRAELGEEPSLWFDSRFGYAPTSPNRRGWLWPLGGFLTGATPGSEMVVSSVSFDDETLWTSASHFPYRIRGFAKDSDGNPVGNAVMKLYRASDEQFLRSSVSDGSGQYDLGVDDNTTQYYIVAYRSGPDIEGTTVKTLVGS